MDKPPKTATVSNYRLTPAVAEKRIKALAIQSENIGWGLHALDRMIQRGIYDVDALRVMRQGFCDGNPERTERGEWKAKMVRRMVGAREIGVVVVILKSNRLFVKTVEWEDAQ